MSSKQLISEGTVSIKEWNENIVPHVGKEIKDISHELPPGFLMVGQTMDALVEYKGKKYSCVGWQQPGDKGRVEITER